MKKYLITLPIVLTVGLLFYGTFLLGRGTAPVRIEYKLGTAEPQSLSSMITESCQCPTPEVYVDVGCVDDIKADNIRFRGNKIQIYDKKERIYKEYLNEDITDSVIEETSILDYKTIK